MTETIPTGNLTLQGVVVPVFNPGQGPLLEREIATQAILIETHKKAILIQNA